MIHVVVTSPRVAPGLMTATAWDVVRGVERVASSDRADPVAMAVAAAGVAVYEVPEISGSSEPLRLLRELATPGADLAFLLTSTGEPAMSPGAYVGLLTTAAEATDAQVVHGSHDLPGGALVDLVALMDRLRTACPWDREQTHQSLARHLVEETYETLEAIETGDRTHLREELGDLLLQVIFHARLAAEDPDDPWDVDDVARGIVTKLVHRHPHVYAGLDIADVAQLEVNWETLKAQEKRRNSVLTGVPASLPALARAEKLLGRVARAGLIDVDVASGEGPVGALGDELFDLARRARQKGLDPEQALRAAIGRFSAAVRRAESGG